jgi:pyruvate,water dikinase
MNPPRILTFDQIKTGDAVGGKAAGLARLIRMQLHVPPGFVILDASPGHYPTYLEAHYTILCSNSGNGGKVAVRSSAIGEDSSGASFAGQYETILNVQGMDALKKAIDHCLASIHSERASAYRAQQAGPGAVPMSIVVQEMVNARCAGVLFTIDPVNPRHDRLVIDAVSGTGEKLVSGEATPDHTQVDRNSKQVIHQELTGSTPILAPEDIRQLVDDALNAEKIASEPLDMEWAIDQAGKVCWLQARPVTTLAGDLNELDSPLLAPDHIFTKCNVSEALPGALCPLTHSVSGRGLDLGMQQVFINLGILEKEDERDIVFGQFYGHLFINMTTMAWTPKKVLGISADDLGLAVCGRVIPELNQQVKKAPLWQRIPRIITHFRTLFNAEQNRDHLRYLVATVQMENQNTALAQWQMIDRNLFHVNDAFYDHYVSSMGAGTLAPLLLGIFAKGKPPTDEHHALVAALLAGAKGVESANIAEGATRLQHLLAQQNDVMARFVNVKPAQALAYLDSNHSGEAGRAWQAYLERHGHRSISEMDIRMDEWAHNPEPLVETLQVSLRGMLEQEHTQPRPAIKIHVERNRRALLAQQNFIIKKLVGMAHNAVHGREASKSLLVKVLQKYKIAYRHLAQLMIADHLLHDKDQLYFFTHRELGKYIESRDAMMLKQAILRRKAFAIQKTLVFPDVFTGVPVPVKPDLSNIPADKLVRGKIVSRGYIIGRAKIAHTVSEASKLEAGDVLIAPITDVAWTPYFALIGGLVTDIGSAVSHGAVVAREYGLPAIVKTDIGTQTFKDGDIVVLDANEGYVRIATEKEAKAFKRK